MGQTFVPGIDNPLPVHRTDETFADSRILEDTLVHLEEERSVIGGERRSYRSGLGHIVLVQVHNELGRHLPVSVDDPGDEGSEYSRRVRNGLYRYAIQVGQGLFIGAHFPVFVELVHLHAVVDHISLELERSSAYGILVKVVSIDIFLRHDPRVDQPRKECAGTLAQIELDRVIVDDLGALNL